MDNHNVTASFFNIHDLKRGEEIYTISLILETPQAQDKSPKPAIPASARTGESDAVPIPRPSPRLALAPPRKVGGGGGEDSFPPPAFRFPKRSARVVYKGLLAER